MEVELPAFSTLTELCGRHTVGYKLEQEGRLKAMLCLRRLGVGPSPRKAGLIHVGFGVDRVTGVLQFSSADIIPPWLSRLMYHLGDEQKARRWPQFRDVVSPHQHDHVQGILGEITEPGVRQGPCSDRLTSPDRLRDCDADDRLLRL
jgi:hypothetical protein